MPPHIVKLEVAPCLRLECEFWLEDDCWNAAIESMGLAVHAPSFEAAKNDMELALGRHIKALLDEHTGIGRGHAA